MKKVSDNKIADVATALAGDSDATLEIFYDIATLAAMYWEGIDPSDFCLQHVGSTIVFGSTNRLIWSPANGFIPDYHYCSEKFLTRCELLGIHPRKDDA